MVYGACVIATLWAVVWTWIGVAPGLGKGLTLGEGLLHIVFPGLFFALLLFLVRQTEVLVGLLLVSIGVFIAVAFVIISGHLPVNAVAFVILAMALPPLAAGTMFLIDWQLRKARMVRQGEAERDRFNQQTYSPVDGPLG
jgi:hypothetical protein